MQLCRYAEVSTSRSTPLWHSIRQFHRPRQAQDMTKQSLRGLPGCSPNISSCLVMVNYNHQLTNHSTKELRIISHQDEAWKQDMKEQQGACQERPKRDKEMLQQHLLGLSQGKEKKQYFQSQSSEELKSFKTKWDKFEVDVNHLSVILVALYEIENEYSLIRTGIKKVSPALQRQRTSKI